MLGRWRKQESEEPTPATGLAGPRVPRHSGAWDVMRKRMEKEPGLRIIDVGYTSPQNINLLTTLGHSLYMSDLVRDAWAENWKTTQEGEISQPVWNVQGYLDQTLNFSGRTFDVVLLWTALDYLPEPLVQPVVDRLFSAMNPGGQVLALFHTRMQGEEKVLCRFHVTQGSDIEVQLTEQFPIQRAFTNRSIERLFAGWSGHKVYLAKDSISEVIVTR